MTVTLRRPQWREGRQPRVGGGLAVPVSSSTSAWRALCRTEWAELPLAPMLASNVTYRGPLPSYHEHT